MKAIGGYFELELSDNEVFHPGAIAVNSGRNGLKLILQQRNVDHIYVPYYCCKSILKIIKTLNISFELYQLDQLLEIKRLSVLDDSSYLLYINYFGLKGKYVQQLSQSVSKLIVDNSHAFYDQPLSGVDTFYSPRKFFGVPGGGYVYGPALDISLKKDVAYDRCQHLLIRSDLNAEVGYQDFQKNEEQFDERPVKSMSELTHRLLSNINYDQVAKRRDLNFSLLHKALSGINSFRILAESSCVCPLIYPFKNKNVTREKLIGQQIYVPQYWPKIKNSFPDKSCSAYDFANNLIALPIDQRYNEDDMRRIIDVILRYAK